MKRNIHIYAVKLSQKIFRHFWILAPHHSLHDAGSIAGYNVIVQPRFRIHDHEPSFVDTRHCHVGRLGVHYIDDILASTNAGNN